MNIVSKIEDSSIPPNRTEAAKALLTQLRERFPVLADFRPLKLLVHLEVRAALEGVPHIRIADALGWHVNSPRYQKALAKGGPRYNLAGEVAGEVTPDQQQLAVQRLKALNTRKATKANVSPPIDGISQAGKSTEKPPKRPTKATPPQPAPTPPPTTDALGRPILRLKPKASAVVQVSVSRKGGKP